MQQWYSTWGVIHWRLLEVWCNTGFWWDHTTWCHTTAWFHVGFCFYRWWVVKSDAMSVKTLASHGGDWLEQRSINKQKLGLQRFGTTNPHHSNSAWPPIFLVFCGFVVQILDVAILIYQALAVQQQLYRSTAASTLRPQLVVQLQGEGSETRPSSKLYKCQRGVDAQVAAGCFTVIVTTWMIGIVNSTFICHHKMMVWKTGKSNRFFKHGNLWCPS